MLFHKQKKKQKIGLICARYCNLINNLSKLS